MKMKYKHYDMVYPFNGFKQNFWQLFGYGFLYLLFIHTLISNYNGLFSRKQSS